MHEWEDGERVPKLQANDERLNDKPESVRPLVYGDAAAPLPVQPQRQWVGLTDTERNDIWKKEVGWGDPSHDDEDLMKAIEQALKDKNT